MAEKQHHNLFKGVLDTFSEMNRMREQVTSGSYEGSPHQEQPRTHATAWIPTTDIFANGTDLILRCELAGVGQDDISITLSGEALVISGERSSELDLEETNFLVRERFYGNFRRRVKLPAGIEDEDISASFYDGMLEITVRNGAVSQEPRTIQIRTER